MTDLSSTSTRRARCGARSYARAPAARRLAAAPAAADHLAVPGGDRRRRRGGVVRPGAPGGARHGARPAADQRAPVEPDPGARAGPARRGSAAGRGPAGPAAAARRRRPRDRRGGTAPARGGARHRAAEHRHRAVERVRRTAGPGRGHGRARRRLPSASGTTFAPPRAVGASPVLAQGELLYTEQVAEVKAPPTGPEPGRRGFLVFRRRAASPAAGQSIARADRRRQRAAPRIPRVRDLDRPRQARRGAAAPPHRARS